MAHRGHKSRLRLIQFLLLDNARPHYTYIYFKINKFPYLQYFERNKGTAEVGSPENGRGRHDAKVGQSHKHGAGVQNLRNPRPINL